MAQKSNKNNFHLFRFPRQSKLDCYILRQLIQLLDFAFMSSKFYSQEYWETDRQINTRTTSEISRYSLNWDGMSKDWIFGVKCRDVCRNEARENVGISIRIEAHFCRLTNNDWYHCLITNRIAHISNIHLSKSLHCVSPSLVFKWERCDLIICWFFCIQEMDSNIINNLF